MFSSALCYFMIWTITLVCVIFWQKRKFNNNKISGELTNSKISKLGAGVLGTMLVYISANKYNTMPQSISFYLAE